MKSVLYKLFPFIAIIFLSGCIKRNFFPDEDDPGLSRLTSYGFNIATAYINLVPYINPYKKTIFGGANYEPTLRKVFSTTAFDTLSLSWPIEINDSDVNYNQPYQNITLQLPVLKSFTQQDLLALNGKRFSSNNNTIIIQSYSNQPNALIGLSDIYFININTDPSYSSPTRYIISGLFNGNIGDSIHITKGRFDFEISSDKMNF